MNSNPVGILNADNLNKTLELGWQSYNSVQAGNEFAKSLKYEEAEKCFRIVVAETQHMEQYVSAIGGLLLMSGSVDDASRMYAKGLAKIEAWFGAIANPSAEEEYKKTALVFEIQDRYADFFYPIDPERSRELSSAAVGAFGGDACVDIYKKKSAPKR